MRGKCGCFGVASTRGTLLLHRNFNNRLGHVCGQRSLPKQLRASSRTHTWPGRSLELRCSAAHPQRMETMEGSLAKSARRNTFHGEWQIACVLVVDQTRLRIVETFCAEQLRVLAQTLLVWNTFKKQPFISSVHRTMDKDPPVKGFHGLPLLKSKSSRQPETVCRRSTWDLFLVLVW